ncbi:hypothetical protein [Ewingella americana]|uniref:Uncharacterized protein n=1 Tax=Ewingella americana TaxID=41202 RepID=A0A502GCM7_9GAMM|nr:hypothetical protein [Ewingella americana]TPG60027.1 hypothetical protein EAH77_15785 [Ewingella americana]
MPNVNNEEEYEFTAQVTVKVKLSVRTDADTPVDRKRLASQIANNYLQGKIDGNNTGASMTPAFHAYGVSLSKADKPVFTKRESLDGK